jgi:hypothetical protein
LAPDEYPHATTAALIDRSGPVSANVIHRDTHDNEVDLVIRQAGALVPIEIKSAATFAPDFLRSIDHFGAVVGDRFAP